MVKVMDINSVVKNKDAICTGLVYKAHVSLFNNSKGHIVEKRAFQLMKRMSCKCVKCRLMIDYVHTAMGLDALAMPVKVIDNTYYKPILCGTSDEPIVTFWKIQD